MPVIKEEDIVGYSWYGQIYCKDCVPDPGEGRPFTASDLEDGHQYFCQDCGEEITEN